MTAAASVRNEVSIFSVVEYADLRKEVTYGDIEALCLEAKTYGVGTVAVASGLVGRAAVALEGAARVACPIAYPFGTQAVAVKAREAEVAVDAGAAELDVVPHFGALRAGRWTHVADELQAVARAAHGATLKLVLEVGALDDQQLEDACRAARDAGFTFVANAIGFRIVSTQPETLGTASVEALRRLVRAAGQSLGVKAVGGAQTPEAVTALRVAGASRVSVSAERGLLRRWNRGGAA